MLWLSVLLAVIDPATICPVVRLPLAIMPNITSREDIQADFDPELPGRVSLCWDSWSLVEAVPARDPETELNE